MPLLDPDPVRGGKIVIQAKRYTNTVGVSAVLFIWNCAMNEGATKGGHFHNSRLWTRCYEFVKGKPLTLK
jgi:restriction system protein